MKEKFLKTVNVMKKNKKKITAVAIALIAILAIVFASNVGKRNNNVETKALREEAPTQEMKGWYEVNNVVDNKIQSTIVFRSTLENIEYVKSPKTEDISGTETEYNTITPEQDMKMLAVDYELTDTKTYTFKIKTKESTEEQTWQLIASKNANIAITMSESSDYAEITKDGVVLTKQVTLTNTTEGSFINYYSIDDGETWQTYTEPFKAVASSKKVLAKVQIASTEVNTIERVQKADVVMNLASDALNTKTYDGNVKTYQLVRSGNIKYIKLAEEMQGHRIRIKCSGGDTVGFLKEDKVTAAEINKQIKNINSTTQEIKIPDEAKWLKIKADDDISIYELEVIPSVKVSSVGKGKEYIKVEVDLAKIDGTDLRYNYYLNGTKQVDKTTSTTNEYSGLTEWTEYNIKVTIEGTGYEDTIKVKTKASNNSLIGYIGGDVKNSSSDYTTTLRDVTYNFDVLYIDRVNIDSYGTYNSATNTYTITRNIELGDPTQYKMAVLKCPGNLEIAEGVTITTARYSETVTEYTANKKESIDVTGLVTKEKGLFIYCDGTLTNNGTISQTARGTYGAEGENIYLWSKNESYDGYVVPSVGASGGIVHRNGANGSNRASGGGRRWRIASYSRWEC